MTLTWTVLITSKVRGAVNVWAFDSGWSGGVLPVWLTLTLTWAMSRFNTLRDNRIKAARSSPSQRRTHCNDGAEPQVLVSAQIRARYAVRRQSVGRARRWRVDQLEGKCLLRPPRVPIHPELSHEELRGRFTVTATSFILRARRVAG